MLELYPCTYISLAYDIYIDEIHDGMNLELYYQ